MHYHTPSEANPWDSARSFKESSRSSRSVPVDSDSYSDVPTNDTTGSHTPIFDDLPGLSNSMSRAALDDADEECLRGTPDPGSPQPGSSKRAGLKKGKHAFAAYVVFAGHETGIFCTWDAASFQLDNYDGFPRWKGYPTLQAAKDAWAFAVANGTVGKHPPTPKKATGRPQPTSSPPTPSQPSTSQSTSTHPHPTPPSSPRRPNPSRPSSSSRQQLSEEEPSLTELSRQKRLTREQCWYSVIRGDRPGVYFGASAAGNAAGSHSRPKIVKHTSGEAAANRFFVQQIMLSHSNTPSGT